MHNDNSPMTQLLTTLFRGGDLIPTNTIAGAGMGVIGAVLAYKFTKNPLIVGLAALCGAWGAYHGCEVDLAIEYTPPFFR